MSYAKPDGTIAGAEYELAKLVFKKLGVPNLEGVLAKFGSLIPALQANRFDGGCRRVLYPACALRTGRLQRTNHRGW
jgi:ABC-type amino acid transport substrate-binding protein